MRNMPKSRLIAGVIVLILAGIFIAGSLIMVNFYDSVSGFSFIPTPTAFSLEIGEVRPDFKRDQRAVFEGVFVYPSQISSMDLGKYGWRDKLFLLDPVTWNQIPIWFESTSQTEKEPNKIKGIGLYFDPNDILAYDYLGLEVHPGDHIKVEGRLAPAGEDWHLIVERVELVKGYPEKLIEEGYANFGDVSLLDRIRVDDFSFLFVFQTSKKLSLGYVVDLDDSSFDCNYWNHIIYCYIEGFKKGDSVRVDLYQAYQSFDHDDLMFSEDVEIP